MTDHAPFLAAIIARPLDDLPRLIYADWLDETAGDSVCPTCGGDKRVTFPGAERVTFGNPYVVRCEVCHGTGSVLNGHAGRAEFIRVQCRLAEHERAAAMRGNTFLPVPAMPPGFLIFSKREALRRRERELLTDDNRTRWFAVQRLGVQLGDDPNLLYWWIQPGGPRIEGVIRRGFVEEIACSWPDWQQHAAAIRAATPLRRVRLTTWPQWRHRGRVISASAEPTLWQLESEYPSIEFELPQQRDVYLCRRPRECDCPSCLSNADEDPEMDHLEELEERLAR